MILRNLANKAAKGDLKATAFVFNLINSPEYADADTIDPNNLSSDDQEMLASMMDQLTGGEHRVLNASDETGAIEDNVIIATADHKASQTEAVEANNDETNMGGEDNV